MSLLDALPRPATVRVAGRAYRALPLRLADLAAFERLARDRAASPLAPLDGADPAGPGYPDALRAAFRAAEAWPPSFGSPAVDEAIGSPEGVALLLRATLRASRPRLDARAARRLAACIEPDELDAVRRVAYDDHPLAAAAALVDAHLGVDYGPGPADETPADETPPDEDEADDDPADAGWAGVLARLCESLGRLPEEVGRLTIGQARCLLSGGRRREVEPSIPAGADPARVVEFQDRKFAFWHGTGFDFSPIPPAAA